MEQGIRRMGSFSVMAWRGLIQPGFLRCHGARPLCPRCRISTRPNLHKATTREKGYALLVIPAATFALGVWQVQRRQWKLDLIQELHDRTTAPPISFPMDLEEIRDLEYKKVVLRGSFDHQRELIVQPRAPVEDDDNPRGMMSAGAGSRRIGAHIITPFRLADRDLTILVNRGWVPRDRLKPETRQQGQIEGEIELVGVVRLTEKRQPFGANNVPGKNRWLRRDVEAMAETLDTAPIFLDADRNSTVQGGPLGGQTRVTVRNEHLSYIFTWFSLSAITSAMWYRRYILLK